MKLKTYAGDSFDEISKKAKEVATKSKISVEFEFNGINCIVSESTILDCFYRDYSNAHLMGWGTVGPVCDLQYSPDTEIELYTRKLERAKENKRMYEEMDRKEKADRQLVQEKINGITLLIHPDKAADYQQYVKSNTQD